MSDQELIAFVNSLIGKPYEKGAEGPDTFDCWGLPRYIALIGFGQHWARIEPPSGNNAAEDMRFVQFNPERENWHQCGFVAGTKREGRMAHGGLAEMSHNGHPFHVGMTLKFEGGGIIHAPRPAVRYDAINALTGAGWKRLTFYERR